MAVSSKPARNIRPSGIFFWGDRSEQDRVGYIIDEIVGLLRQHPRGDQSEAQVRNFVAIASAIMMGAGRGERIQKDKDILRNQLFRRRSRNG
jgi:hypothetical protein